MASKIKPVLPVAVAVAVIVFIYLEVALNFTFHWVTDGNLGNGLSLPSNFHLVPPAGFVSWGMFFALGADNSALRSVAINSLIGAVAALALFAFVTATKGLPDFWTISLGTALLGFIIIVGSAVWSWIAVPVIFTGFAAAVFWWVATGLDGWAPHGGGIGNSVAALSKPATAGAGAFGGVISTPYGWVALNVAVTLLVGCVCGAATVRLAALITPRQRAAAAGQAPAAN